MSQEMGIHIHQPVRWNGMRRLFPQSLCHADFWQTSIGTRWKLNVLYMLCTDFLQDIVFMHPIHLYCATMDVKIHSNIQ